MKQVNKRLDNLEDAAKPGRGYVVLWADLEGDGYWDQHFSDPDRRRISEDDLRALELRNNVIIVEYIKDWRAADQA